MAGRFIAAPGVPGFLSVMARKRVEGGGYGKAGFRKVSEASKWKSGASEKFQRHQNGKVVLLQIAKGPKIEKWCFCKISEGPEMKILPIDFVISARRCRAELTSKCNFK